MAREHKLPPSRMLLPDVAPDPLDGLIEEMFLRMDMGDTELEQLCDGASVDDELQTSASSEETIEVSPSATDTMLPTETMAGPGSARHDEMTNEGLRQTAGNVGKFEKEGRVTFLGKYRKVTELGRGGQGIVYRIEGEDEFSAAFALKVFLPQAYSDLNDYEADMPRMQCVASRIHRHPHNDLVGINWFGQRDGVYTMLMQYIDGLDLRRLVRPQFLQSLKQCVEEERWKDINNVVYSENGTRQLALQPAIAVYIIEHVLRGLSALHSLNIVHGDIKPSNIMLNASGGVKIIDVGSAFEVCSPPARHHFTPAYVAPEFFETERISKQSDIASAGYMLIELLSGEPITDEVCEPDESTRMIGGPRREKMLEAKNSLSDRLTDILPNRIVESNHLMELCRRLIDPDLNRRFSTAAESIVHRDGTYEFTKDLMQAGLGVCNYYEVSQLLANAKQAMRLAREASSLPK